MPRGKQRDRRFGSVRRLPSGKFQASFIGPNGKRQAAPNTFSTRVEAERWLLRVHESLEREEWRDSGAQLGRRTLKDYAESYLTENPNVGERWAETSRRNMRLHLTPLLDMPVASITPAVVRSWHAQALAGTGGRTSIAQTYRLLRSVLNMAVLDEAIQKNPCQIPRAGTDRPKERPIASPAEVAALIEAITPRYRAAVALAAWCGLRRGELMALRVTDVDLEKATVRVDKTYVELLESRRRFEKEPKSQAGRRVVSIPPHVLPLMAEHLETWAGPEFFFVGHDGTRMAGNALYQAFVRARKVVGVNLSFHDLRHTGQTLAAATGASLADLKRRLGHSSTAAALRYMHAVEGRDAEIAAALSAVAEANNATQLPSR
ncbi:integrase family protein [Intrasporangium calvum DSM 43043]|uniref:Integrase family protein n=1 Tax=Intrasporangium calvum (strain ATCC 23552 / DSM 43043 / JCM 3097 / NBRC 12989 / NCIMB 10167 / NRRL B-3866 / 7 KIP) TaxID=710696 RepID=E6SCL0_INTC7|nr:integrase family protein [Intrasporangium calvum DSM 43043]